MSLSILRRAFWVAVCLAALLSASAQSADKRLAKRFDWPSIWGSILPDTGIPSNRFAPKRDIVNAVENCGLGDTNYSKIGSYAIDINGDGQTDVVTEAAGYFGQGYNTATCPIAICSAAFGQGNDEAVFVSGAVRGRFVQSDRL